MRADAWVVGIGLWSVLGCAQGGGVVLPAVGRDASRPRDAALALDAARSQDAAAGLRTMDAGDDAGGARDGTGVAVVADAGVWASCRVATEVCNALDDDCDGRIDEAPAATFCGFAHGVARCGASRCELEGCEPGFADENHDARDGCERTCGTSDVPDELGRDDDCDGIDGSEVHAVFVSPFGTTGAPGTRTAPKASLAEALAAAARAHKDVYVAAGTYLEPTLVLSDGVSIYGGFDPSTWAGPRRAYTVVRSRDATAARATGLRQRLTLDRVELHASDAAPPLVPGAGATSSFALVVRDVSMLVVRDAVLEAGRGGDATLSRGPAAGGASGGDGQAGAPGCENSGGVCSSCGRPRGGAGGVNAACDAAGGAGGAGGLGASFGAQGNSGRVGTAGGAGAPPERGNWSTPALYWGADGAAGGAGPSGAAVAGSFRAEGFVPGDGGSGGAGTDGHGGGGGGGGGGGDDGCNSYGGGGGGGGAGGCGGGGGAGGRGGGASVALLVWGASSVSILRTTFRSARGGAGAAGAPGAVGGNGGHGGHGSLAGAGGFYGGAAEQDDASNGGRGGDGGAGGRGGDGAGGAGGASVGVVRARTSVVTTDVCRFELGLAGVGGASARHRGPDGVRTETLVVP